MMKLLNMRHFIMTVVFSVVILVMANANVLGIFESTGFPAGLESDGDGRHRLEIVDNGLYASTENGIYRYSEETSSWHCWALEGFNVIDFKVCGENVVAIVVPEGWENFRNVEVARLVRINRSQPEPEDIAAPDMGLDYYGKKLMYLMRLAQHPERPETLMVAAYPGIWISEDFGTTWSLKIDYLFTYNENQFLGWHPLDPEVMFYTSESEGFAAQILRSGNGGSQWNIINPPIAGDNSCHHLAFDPDNSNHILFSGEGVVCGSNDCGSTWRIVYQQDRFNDNSVIGYAYNVMFDPANPDVVYVVGADSTEQNIRIIKSQDRGMTWTPLARSEPFEDHDYWIHESVMFNGRIYLYTHAGVLAYDPDRSSGVSGIRIDTPAADNPVYDLYGRKVTELNPGSLYIRRGEKFIAK